MSETFVVQLYRNCYGHSPGEKSDKRTTLAHSRQEAVRQIEWAGTVVDLDGDRGRIIAFLDGAPAAKELRVFCKSPGTSVTCDGSASIFLLEEP